MASPAQPSSSKWVCMFGEVEDFENVCSFFFFFSDPSFV